MNARQINYLHPSAELLERARREHDAIIAAQPATVTLTLDRRAAIAAAQDASDRYLKADAKATDPSRSDEFRAEWAERARFWESVATSLDLQLAAAGVIR